MRIVIAGAGDVGFHLAKLLSLENKNIVIIDSDEGVLENAENHLDVMTIQGSCTDAAVLREAQIDRAQVYLAVTTSEETNLFSASVAKKLGAGSTIARVDSLQTTLPENQELLQSLGIDRVISPSALAAEEIQRLLKESSFTDLVEFENGKIDIVGGTIDEHSSITNLSVAQVNEKYPNINFRPFAILRGHQTISPTEDTILRRRDHFYLLAQNSELEEIGKLNNKENVRVKNVMIIGGNQLARMTAELLEKDYNLTIVAEDQEECKQLVAKLDRALVIEGNPSNVEILKEEGLEKMDAFLALTSNSETNILSSLMAEQFGVYKTIAHVDNADYTQISQNIGVDTLINKKLIAANNIFKYTRKGNIEAIATFQGLEAEIIEYHITEQNQLTKKTIQDLRLPERSKIIAVVRNDDTIIPDGNFQMNLNDKVFVFAMPGDLPDLENIFK